MDLKDVGRQLQLLRQAAGLTLREAAPRAGTNKKTGKDELSFQMLNVIEGGGNTTLETLDKIVTGLGGSLEVRIRLPRQAADQPTSAPPVDRFGVVKRVTDLLPRLTDADGDVLGELRYLEEQADEREGRGRDDD
jgi:transcriptional regulator with XRE-family HTH domain